MRNRGDRVKVGRLASSWIFRVPGLRRFGQRLEHSEQQLRGLRTKLDKLQARSRADRADFADRIQHHKARQLAPDVLRQVFGARFRALIARPSEAAAARDAHHLTASPSYANALRADGHDTAHDTTHDTTGAPQRVTIDGVVWCVPKDAGGGGDLSDRIAHGWLPFHGIMATRELAVGGAMIDVGANVGTTAITRVILGDFDHVWAAEPDPDNFACLVENVAANGLRGRVMPDHVAIGATDGSATLRRKTKIGVHHLTTGTARKSDVTVSVVTLDSWVARMGIAPTEVTFVKVDTQGWEADVLRGAPRLLAHPHIAWQLEFSPRMLQRSGSTAADLFALLEKHFTHFIDLGRFATPRVRPIAQVREDVAYVEQRERRFTDLLLYQGRTFDE